ncbi:MAG: DNA-processing protein DprA [Phycisphaerales bacterium]|nr:DNA-processing protein DprA [Phycisphaerales bacterium]
MPGDRPSNPISDDPRARQLLALTLVPNLGPVLINRLLERFGSPEGVLGATASALSGTRGIGRTLAAQIARDLAGIHPRVDEELEKIQKSGAHVVTLFDDGYPPLLAQVPGAPPVLTVRGELRSHDRDRYTISIVGSRKCTLYGSEQATRFSGALASAGLTVVSGGARGIDTAAHKGALSVNGRTTVVLGCGLKHTYPPENERLFAEIVDRGGAIVSELPIETAPVPRNFPARNRIISGMSLGVIVIEAAKGSGALITARHATEDHGREVMGIPGRVDAPASAGTNELLKSGAHLVTEPSDVLEILERDARHLFAGTHHARTADPRTDVPLSSGVYPRPAVKTDPLAGVTDPVERSIIEGLGEPRTGDELAELLAMTPGEVRAKLTMLEISGRVRRVGSRFCVTTSGG